MIVRVHHITKTFFVASHRDGLHVEAVKGKGFYTLYLTGGEYKTVKGRRSEAVKAATNWLLAEREREAVAAATARRLATTHLSIWAH